MLPSPELPYGFTEGVKEPPCVAAAGSEPPAVMGLKGLELSFCYTCHLDVFL